MKQMLKRFWWVLPLLLVLAVLAFVFWASIAAAPMPEAIAALHSDALVEVDTEPWLVFQPVGSAPRAGLILYPGGKVDPRAYAPPARSVAEKGYLVVIVPMPLNLAVLGSSRAADVMAAFPQIDHWGVGGHSLGGAMAAHFSHQNPDAVRGLVLWAAYPASGDDLSGYDLAVISISGTLDGLATEAKIAASRPLLPPDTDWLAIEGGNHAQFGWYGPQSGDNPATISRRVQQGHIVQATLALLEKVEGQP